MFNILFIFGSALWVKTRLQEVFVNRLPEDFTVFHWSVSHIIYSLPFSLLVRPIVEIYIYIFLD